MTVQRPQLISVYGTDYIGASQGEADFAVSYASGNLLAVAGAPFSFTEINVSYVKHLPISGTLKTYTLDDTKILTRTDDTIQIDAAEFEEDDHFEVGLKGQKKGYNPTSDSKRTYNVASMPTGFDTYQEITGSVLFDLSSSWTSASAWQDCASQVSARVFIEYGFSGASDAGANTLYLKLLETRDNTDTNEEYSEPQIELTAGTSDIQQNLYTWTPRTFDNVTGSCHGYQEWRTYFDIDVKGAEGFKMAYSESIGPNSTTGTLNIYYTMFDQ